MHIWQTICCIYENNKKNPFPQWGEGIIKPLFRTTFQIWGGGVVQFVNTKYCLKKPVFGIRTAFSAKIYLLYPQIYGMGGEVIDIRIESLTKRFLHLPFSTTLPKKYCHYWYSVYLLLISSGSYPTKSSVGELSRFRVWWKLIATSTQARGAMAPPTEWHGDKGGTCLGTIINDWSLQVG